MTGVQTCALPICTLGVPLFQEQMLQIAMVMANFTGDEADELRRAVSFHRSDDRMRRCEEKLRIAMINSGVTLEIADRIVKAVGSFALYGFPESHAISFALLAYASAYLKVHRPSEFYTALLNNQPMGFYSSATLIKDAQSRGIRIRPVSISASNSECSIEGDGSIRLGLLQVKGIQREHLEQMLSARRHGSFRSMEDFRRRTRFRAEELRALAEVGALSSISDHRRDALWRVEKNVPEEELFGDEEFSDAKNSSPRKSPLKAMTPVERLQADYGGLNLTTGPHPMRLVRSQLPDVWMASELLQARDGDLIRVAGQVICRQRPGTAKGIVFISLEDETGISNVIVSPTLFEARRLTITLEPFLLVEGKAQPRHGTVHIKAIRIDRLEFGELVSPGSHDFH